MLKFWMEEFKPGYWIKYDGFRDKLKYTYINPDGRVGDYETYEEAFKIATEEKFNIGVEIDISVPYNIDNCGKWFVAEVISGKYAGQTVCCIVEYANGDIIADLGSDGEEDSKLVMINRKDLKIIE